MAFVFGYSIDFMNELGRGAFGTVYKGYDPNGDIAAIKKVPKRVPVQKLQFYELKDESPRFQKYCKNIRCKVLQQSYLDHDGIL